jgi:hypothetical protein
VSGAVLQVRARVAVGPLSAMMPGAPFNDKRGATVSGVARLCYDLAVRPTRTMRPYAAILAALLCGCGREAGPVAPPAVAPTQATPEPQALQVVEGDVVLSVGDAKVVIIPPDRDIPGAELLVASVTYENRYGGSVWITGWSPDMPAHDLETRPDRGDWTEHKTFMCGTGVREHAVAPGETHSFDVLLPGECVGHEFRVSLTYRYASPYAGSNSAKALVQARSAPRPLHHPTAGH